MNYNSINPTSLSRYVGLIKNFSPLQRNKLSLKKKFNKQRQKFRK